MKHNKTEGSKNMSTDDNNFIETASPQPNKAKYIDLTSHHREMWKEIREREMEETIKSMAKRLANMEKTLKTKLK